MLSISRLPLSPPCAPPYFCVSRKHSGCHQFGNESQTCMIEQILYIQWHLGLPSSRSNKTPNSHSFWTLNYVTTFYVESRILCKITLYVESRVHQCQNTNSPTVSVVDLLQLRQTISYSKDTYVVLTSFNLPRLSRKCYSLLL